MIFEYRVVIDIVIYVHTINTEKFQLFDVIMFFFQCTGYWLHKQRRMKRLGTLPRIRFEKLDALAADTQGPGKLLWNMESAFLVRDDIWDKMCTAFEEYSAEHSSSLRTPQHSNLGTCF